MTIFVSSDDRGRGLGPTPGERTGCRPFPDVDAVRRERLRPLAALALALAAGLPRAVGAHHGFAGMYDFSRPLYLAGVIDAIWIGRPHVRIRLRLDGNLALPRNREPYRALEDAEARQMLGRLRLPDRRGLVDVVLHARLTRGLINEPEVLPVGMHTEIIGYPRLTQDEYRGEIVGVLVKLHDGRMLVGSTSMRSRPGRAGASGD